MGKVWNISGSFFGSSNLIPENATFTKLEVLPTSLDTYYNGELFRQDLTFFQATFTSDEGEETKISLPSSEVHPKNFDPNVPFSNTLDREYQTVLQFEWTYKPDGDEGEGQYRDCSFTVTIWPEKFTVKKVEVIVPPNKTVYYDGEIFDEEGMVVQATSKEGDTKQINYCGDDTLNCNNASDCYWYSRTPLRSNDSETTEVIFNYCVSADAEHPNGYIAQFTYPVTVYQDERKAQLRVTYDKDTTKQVYYSGTTFNKTGIKVEAKYPRDDESVFDQNNVTTQCKIYVQEFPDGVLQYNDSNLGYLNVVVEYYDSTTKLTTTEVIPNIVFVYEVDAIYVSNSSQIEFYVGNNFSSSYATLRVEYKPASLPVDSYQNFKMSNDYSWATSQYIDSSGKFLKSGDQVQIGIRYSDKEDPKSPKTVYTTTHIVKVMKQVYELKVPEYTGDETYEMGTDGIKILRYLGITSGTSLSQGYEDIFVNGAWNYGTPSNIDRYYTASSSQYQYEIGVRGKLEDDTYTYVWDDGYNTPANEVKYVSVSLKILVSQIVNLNASADTTSLVAPNSGHSGSSSTRVSVGTGGQGLPDSTTFRASESSSYLSVSPSSVTDYSADFTVSATSNSSYSGTKSGTVTFKADSITQDDGWRKLTTTFNSDSVSFSIKYKDPWEWTSSTYSSLTNYSSCNDWWNGFSSNITTSNASNYEGRKVRVFFGSNSSSYIDFYYTNYVSGLMFFRSVNKVSMTTYGASSGRFTENTSTSLVNQWSGGSTNPQIACKTLQSNGQSYCRNWYSLAETPSKYYGISTNIASSSTSCTAYTSYKIWLPSYRELFGAPSSNDASIIRECTDSFYAYSSCLSGYSTSGSFWIRNGSYAATSGVNQQRVATYYSTSALNSNGKTYHVARVGLPDQSTSTPGSGIYLAFCIGIGGAVG